MCQKTKLALTAHLVEIHNTAWDSSITSHSTFLLYSGFVNLIFPIIYGDEPMIDLYELTSSQLMLLVIYMTMPPIFHVH